MYLTVTRCHVTQPAGWLTSQTLHNRNFFFLIMRTQKVKDNLIAHIEFVRPTIPDDSNTFISTNYEVVKRNTSKSNLMILKPKYKSNSSLSASSSDSVMSGQDVENFFTPPPKVLYPRSQLKSFLNWQTKESTYVGLINQGNTCFMNASLQCLFFTPAFSQYIMKSGHIDHCLLFFDFFSLMFILLLTR